VGARRRSSFCQTSFAVADSPPEHRGCPEFCPCYDNTASPHASRHTRSKGTNPQHTQRDTEIGWLYAGGRARAIRPKWGSLVGEDAYALVVLDAREHWYLVLSRVGRHMALERG
jgi:hypothetical protein